MWRFIAFLGLAACGTSNGNHGADAGNQPISDGGVDLAAASPADLAGTTLEPAGTFVLSLDAGAFPPGPHPSALVYIPSRFDPTPPLSIVVYLHGFDNCVENVVRDAGEPCTKGGANRAAYALASQLETSGKNAILLCPEVMFDQSTGAPGNLGLTNGFRALLTETLADLAAPLGNATLADVGTVVVASHSGGYDAADGLINKGGVPISELYMLDSLYDGNAATTFDPWVKMLGPGHRYGNVYTSGGGTLALSQAQGTRMSTFVHGDMGLLLDDRTTDTLTDAQYAHELIFKLSALAHDAVPTYYFGKFVGSSSLPDKK